MPTPEDLRWLGRVTWGVDSATLAQYQVLGRDAYLEEQLTSAAKDAPELAAQLVTLPLLGRSAAELLIAARAEQQRINALTDEDDKRRARGEERRAANEAVLQAAQRQLLRNLYSQEPLREQMTWFWMNHFNVFSNKGGVRWALAEFEDHDIRPRALGKFSDLVMATLTSPAMLIYLDNAQSRAGKINENYARELMELHTLGVSEGTSGSHYSQEDVQELARVLTGVGLNATGEAPRIAPKLRALLVSHGVFEFNPARHDFGEKTVLGHRIAGRGFEEVREVIDLLCRQPATARHISKKLARYFVADEPPPSLVDAMTRTFLATDGDLKSVLRVMFHSTEFNEAVRLPEQHAALKLKMPMQFVISSLRMQYDGERITSVRPILGWLNQLGQPMYGRVTPDGYADGEAAWSSPGQWVKRFEVAQAMVHASQVLGVSTASTSSARRDALTRATVATFSAPTKVALAQATNTQERHALMLASPEWMMR